MWHIYDSQDQILALAFRLKFLKPFGLFPFRSEWVRRFTKRQTLRATRQGSQVNVAFTSCRATERPLFSLSSLSLSLAPSPSHSPSHFPSPSHSPSPSHLPITSPLLTLSPPPER